MQKFQAKGGVATTDIILSPATDTPFIDILDKDNKSQFHMSMESGSAGFYGRTTEDLRDIKTPKNGATVVYAAYYNKTMIVVEGVTGSGAGTIYISRDFGTSYTLGPTIPANYNTLLLQESIYDQARDLLYLFGVGFIITLSANFSKANVTNSTGDNYGSIIHNGEVYFICSGGTPSFSLMKISNTSVTLVNKVLQFGGGVASKDGVMYGISFGPKYYQSTNNGTTFTEITALPVWFPTGANFINGYRGTLVFAGGGYSDYKVWTVTDLTKAPVLVKHIPGINGNMYVGAGGNIQDDTIVMAPDDNTKPSIISTDNGATWTEYPGDLVMKKPRFAFKVEDYAVVYGSPFKYVVKSLSSAITGPILQIKANGIYSAFPQPADGNSFARKDYVDGLVASSASIQRPEIIAETDKLYLKLSGGTLTGDTQVNAKLSINSTSPTIDFKVSDTVKYSVGVNGDNFEFGTGAPPSTYTPLSTIPGASTVVYDATKFNNVLYAVGSSILSKSTNNGVTWQNFTLPGAAANTDWLRVSSIDGTLIILGKDNGTGTGYRYISQDGIAWTRMTNPAGSRIYDNPAITYKTAGGKYIIAGLGFVSISDTINGTYKRFEWHANTPAVPKYCFAISEHGGRIVAHVQDTAANIGKAFTSTDAGASWTIVPYTGDQPSTQIMTSGKIGSQWYFVDVSGVIFTSSDGIAMTKIANANINPAAVRYASGVFEQSGKILFGDSSGNIRYTSDISAVSAFKTGIADVRVICSTGNSDEYFVFSAIAQVGVVKIQYAGSAFGITPQGPITNRPQQDLPNSLVRRDYVDAIGNNSATKADLNSYLKLSGGELSGNLTIKSDSLIMDNTNNSTIDFKADGARVMAIVSNGQFAFPDLSIRTNDIPVTNDMRSNPSKATGFMQFIDGTWYSASFTANGYIRQSTDDGNIWSVVPGLPVANTDTFTRYTVLGDTHFVGAYNGTLWYNKANAGWKRATTNMSVATMGITLYNGMYYAAIGRGVMRTADPASWTHVYTAPAGVQGTLYDFVVTPEGGLLSYGHAITATSTDGATWTLIPAFSGKHITSAVTYKGKVYVTDYDSGKMYVNTDSTYATWSIVTAYTGTRVIKDSHVVVDGTQYFVDSTGKIYSTTDFATFKVYTVFEGTEACIRLQYIGGTKFYYCTSNNSAVFIVDLGSPALVPLQITKEGVYTNVQQAMVNNALTRKDYVDKTIQNYGYTKTESDGRYVNSTGDGMTGNLDFHLDNQGIRVKFPAGSVANNTGIFGGKGDAALKDKTNININSWYGVGFSPTVGVGSGTTKVVADGENSIWFNLRSGNMYTMGKLFVDEDKQVYSPVNKPTLKDLGAAPSGFGLGETQGPRLPTEDCNKTTASGFYNVYQETLNTPGTSNGPSGSMLLDLHWGQGTGGEAQHQLFFNYDKDELAFRRQRAGEWKPWVKVYTEANKPKPEDIGAATPEDISAGGVSLGSLYWAPSRSTMGVGGVPGDGQTLDRAMYPDLFKLVQDKKVPTCTDTEFLTDPTKRGCYTLGDGTKTFRVPDYNGKTASSVSTFLRGDGLNAGVGGTVQGDAIRNITGTVVQIGHKSGIHYGIQFQDSTIAGAFSPIKGISAVNFDGMASPPVADQVVGFGFDASKVVSTAIDNRPYNVAGVWVIKAAYKVEGLAKVNAEQLSSKVAEIDSKLQTVAGSGTPVLATHWIQLRTAMWNGFIASDGQTLLRAVYPDAWQAIVDRKVPVTTDAEWIANPRKRGYFTEGDGSTTFRIPDLNGVSSGTVGPVYLGAEPANTDGTINLDRIQNITGSYLAMNPHTGNSMWPTGAFAEAKTGSPILSAQTSTDNKELKVTFDASRVARTGDTTRPITVVGCWAIKLFSAQLNQGAVNISALQDKITQLESKHYFYSSKFDPIEINTNSNALLKVRDIQASNGIALSTNKDSVKVSKTGLYKITYSYTLEPVTTYHQNSVLNIKLPNKTADAVAYSYIPAQVSGTGVTMNPCVWSGTYQLTAGDDISFIVSSVNGTKVKIFWTGYFHVEEL